MSCASVPPVNCPLAQPVGCCPPLTITVEGIGLPSGYVNRVFPAAHTSPDSISIAGSVPGILTFTVPMSGGSVTHPTQSNDVTYYEFPNGGGSSLGPYATSWICTVVPLGGGLFEVDIGSFTAAGINQRWARAASVALGGSQANTNPQPPQLSTLANQEAWGVGGLIRVG